MNELIRQLIAAIDAAQEARETLRKSPSHHQAEIERACWAEIWELKKKVDEAMR